MRKIPHVTHMFVHHAGGSPDCELYSPTTPSLAEDETAIARRQTFGQFIRDIDSDLRRLLVEADVIEETIDKRLLGLLEVIVIVKMNASNLTPSIQSVERIIKDHHPENYRISPVEKLVVNFYAQDQARFIDALLCKWLLYCLHLEDDEVDIESVLTSLTTGNQKNNIAAVAAVMLGGVICLYEEKVLAHFRLAFTSLVNSYLKEESPVDLAEGYVGELLDGKWNGKWNGKRTGNGKYTWADGAASR